MTDAEKIDQIQFHFAEIMRTLGLDLSSEILSDTPARVAKMYVKEMFSGLNPDNFPIVSLFENNYGYDDMLLEKDIQIYSCCERHFVPILGKAHIAYFPGRHVIGQSKIHRLVQHFSRRPQVQERLTNDIADALKAVLMIDDVAVCIEAVHLCVASRGIEDTGSAMVSTSFSGRFAERKNVDAFFQMIR